ncbi:TPR Domain containing protein [Trichomonas vaginalis G3]|uniref:TPR Domain containing protein n=1 Tax=Trichomonas vaginalis (strain ATCC PRA-98 / G3) TaxID=412133 RepID=A2FF59_TRIV3|nr:cellular component assembly [Trichomonas vaginalis G3]EAX96472.1 TPR Domain containing protein [Trichomonas vaginalis G3]KAI5503335.1 cellular component assembly [Trichomonas vaginalis G3]|eukprot:XP_001309402.1 TPR Domain containing protein [Trichomonas vaginalis G3]
MHNPTSRYYLEKVNLSFEDSFSVAASVAKDLGYIDDASLATKRAISYNPNNPQVLAIFPDYKIIVERIRKVIEDYGKLLQKETEKTTIWMSLGYCYLALGDFPNAFAACSHIVKFIETPDVNFSYLAGIVYAHFRYTEFAIPYLKNILQLTPNIQIRNDICFRLALLYRLVEQYQQSNEILMSLKENLPHGMSEGDMQLQIAYNLSLQGQPEQSLQIYQSLYQQHPNNIDATRQYFITRLILSNGTMLQELQLELNDALQRFGFDPSLVLIDARVSLKMGDSKQAYEKYKNCIEYCSDSPYFWISLGNLYFKNQQINDALSTFQRALYIRCDIPEPWLNIGLIYELRQDMANAGKFYQTGLQKCPNCREFNERFTNMRAHNSYQLKEVSEDKFFLQIPEKFASDYLASVPLIPDSFIPDMNMSELSVLSTSPKSVFE